VDPHVGGGGGAGGHRGRSGAPRGGNLHGKWALALTRRAQVLRLLFQSVRQVGAWSDVLKAETFWGWGVGRGGVSRFAA